MLSPRKILLALVILTGFQQLVAKKNSKNRKKYDDDDDDDGQPDYCPEPDGMFPNPNDCTSFYNCVGGTPVIQSCAPGLLFDPKTDMCNFPDQVKCSNECRGTDGLFPSQHRCDEFILCTGNKAEVKRCKKGLWFDANLQVCNYKSAVICTLPGGGKNKNKEKFVPTRQCPKAEGIYANPRNCSTFFLCNDGKHHVQECPPGLEYDAHRKRCNYPRLAKCKGNEKGQKLKITIPPKQLVKGEKKKSRLCPELDGIFPNQKNCSTFIFCVDGTAFLQECPKGLVFNPKNVKCDFPEVVGCDPPPGTIKVLVCPKPNGVFLSPDHCNIFYLCSKGRPYQFECPLGLPFDPNSRRCEYHESVSCPPSPRERKQNAHHYMEIREVSVFELQK